MSEKKVTITKGGKEVFAVEKHGDLFTLSKNTGTDDEAVFVMRADEAEAVQMALYSLTRSNAYEIKNIYLNGDGSWQAQP